MNKKLLAFLVLFPLSVSMFIGTVNAEAPTPEFPIVKENYSREEVYLIASLTADKYNINRHEFLITIDQESDFDQYARGDGGESLGACQIHSSNKVPTFKRNDPVYCLEWTAKKFISGEARLWTGYRLCVKHETIIHKGKKLVCTATGTI